MAGFKKPCIHCGMLLEPDASFCPQCASGNPHGYQCPDCLKTVQKGHQLCSNCGRPLYVACPHCGQVTFVQSNCEQCGRTLMVICPNKRCGQPQFFQNKKCTACGKVLRK